jgi:hypothetical protein
MHEFKNKYPKRVPLATKYLIIQNANMKKLLLNPKFCNTN